MSIDPDFIAELRKDFTGDIRNDDASRILYSTDASIYQVEPLGVVLPRTQDDLQAVMELAARHRVPVLPRGSGSSLAGQAIGRAVIVDCSRWLDRLVALDPEQRIATVEPGLILSKLNAAAARHGLQYGPDPASAERATLGGVIANNATGAHSILYGMTADHLLSADVLLADGSAATLASVDLQQARNAYPGASRYGALARRAVEIREQHADLIKQGYPRTWRNSAGYRLNYLLPWSATRPPQWGEGAYPGRDTGSLNLAALLAGSEGTLAVMRRATVRLVPKPRVAVLGILAYDSVVEACEAVPDILVHAPSAVELVPRMLLRLARSVPGYAAQLGWLSGDPAAILIVEFSGEDVAPLVEAARRLRDDVLIAVDPQEQARVWAVRRVGLGILDARPSSTRPVAFIEDCAIPVEQLGAFVREIERILASYQTEGGIYAHASAGCLHIRPILNLKSPEGVAALRPIAGQVLHLAMRLGGAMSSEHGDGIVRGEWLRAEYGDELVALMRSLKQAADPHGLLNPGKMFEAPAMDQQLRYGADYRSHTWHPAFDFAEQGGLDVAIEQCNGQGVCRKDAGVMCPSFQATREEMHSTRGRANLLRALITTGSPGNAGQWNTAAEQRVFEALDLCLMCKGCRAECPSGVDMAKLKFEFLSHYYEGHSRPLRDYVFGYFHVTARLLSAIAPLANAASAVPPVRALMCSVLRLAPGRPLPRFAWRTARPEAVRGAPRVLFLREAFTHFVEARVEQAAYDVLAEAGYDVVPLPTIASTAALLSKGFVQAAARRSRSLLNNLRRLDPEGQLAVVCIEPSELYALRHEYADLVPWLRDQMQAWARRAWSIEELLLRSSSIEKLRIGTITNKTLFHPHCHQKAEPPRDELPIGPAATAELLRICGYSVQLTDAGCCGMAGTFGFEAEHFELSQQVGGLKLFPQLGAQPGLQVAATGAACRMQISQATGAAAEHPLVLAARALRDRKLSEAAAG